MAGIMQQIASLAIGILKGEPAGVRYADLVRKVEEQGPTFKHGVVLTTVFKLPDEWQEDVYKPARGLYRHTSFRGTDEPPKPPKTSEEAFYEPFAKWLVEDSEECTKAIALGGANFRDKWGTPDVIGLRKSRPSDIIKSDIEIVTAEVKADAAALITAFGQACAYKLFSHKSYIVIPKTSPEEDRARIESLCLIFGIGLVLFDEAHPDEPGFEIRVRPVKQEPDTFYVNRYMRIVEDVLFS
jgi:hypothetical protein